MRIVKDPNERRKDIMEAAAHFFLTKGYEETSINQIVEHLGIAKGTFYHYFDSKEAILGAVLEDFLSRFAQGIDAALANEEMNGYDKLVLVLRSILLNTQGPEHLTRHVEDSKNARLHQVLDEKFYEMFYPIIVKVLKQGIQEGIFKLKHPEEITEVLLMGIRAYMHIHLPHFGDPGYMKKKLSALEEIFDKILGVDGEQHRIRLIEKNSWSEP